MKRFENALDDTGFVREAVSIGWRLLIYLVLLIAAVGLIALDRLLGR